MEIILKPGFEKAHVPTKIDKDFSIFLGMKYREEKREKEKYDFINNIIFV